MTPTQTTSFALPRYFTQFGQHPYDNMQWDTRTARITKDDGTVVFEQPNIEVPSFWSETASTVTASKYFRGQLDSPDRERSVKTMVDRVVNTITEWGYQDAYFADRNEAETFKQELKHILIHQMASFNSPVWFNIGCPDRPQAAAACFILAVEDTMPGILEWYRQEALIFSRGAGSGVNVSALRAEGEPITKGGVSSGPLSFMRAADASAFSIKSGGTTRRSARMVVMDVGHPDILKFIWAKAKEEKKARALAQAGFDASMDGEIYATVAHQNCNMSVSVTDDFLRKALRHEVWRTKNRTSYEGQEHKAEDIFRAMAEATWECGDPGAFFHDTVNAWHTTPGLGPILNANPCSEVMRPPNDSCNLASLNLLKFLNSDNSFDIEGFCHTVDVLITAMDILVGRADYPTPAITQNSHDYRTLGLGYANLGALLMAKGLPYDSDEGRDYAASITALMTGQAYKRSAELAAITTPFAGFVVNKDAMLAVIGKHQNAIPTNYHGDIWGYVDTVWNDVVCTGDHYGYRNAQVTLLAPTGTISIIMDCATTGIEPDVALVNYKALVGGGTIKKVNPIVERALKTLGYNGTTAEILKMIETDGGLYSMIREEHVPVFDCAFPSQPGGRSINWQGHIKMVAAVQPFLSGGISKTCNMPNNATVEDIEEAYILAWKLGCKSIAIYRDGCKQTQVLTTQKPTITHSILQRSVTGAVDGWIARQNSEVSPLVTEGSRLSTTTGVVEQPDAAMGGIPSQRRRLPDERPAITHKFSVGGQEGYFTIGLYEDGTPAELFVHIAKEGSTLGGVMDAWATLVSLSLQYGVPLKALTSKLRNARYEPMGFTSHSDIHTASSLTDYIAQWLDLKFGNQPQITVSTPTYQDPRQSWQKQVVETLLQNLDSPLCMECGSQMTRRAGSCWLCGACGATSGACG